MKTAAISTTSLLCFILLGSTATLVAAESSDSPAITLHVAPSGNDAWSGTLPEPNPATTDGPLATIPRAQEIVRKLRAQGGPAKPIVVRIRGVHHLAEPLVITPEESGTADCPVTYTSCLNEKPLLSGGRAITGWKKGEGGLWTVDLPGVKTGTRYFRQLFVDGRRARRARSPNQGYFHVQALVDPKPNARWNEGVDRFRFHPGDIRPSSDLSNVEVIVFHSWNTSRVRIAEVDEANHVVRFTGPTIFRPLGWDPDQRYYVENARELLDSPGEWYLDKTTGTLSYWPLEGEDITRAEVVAPVLGELLRFQGDADAGRFVEHVHVVGLSLAHADWSLPDTGYGDPQAAVTVPAAVTANGARHCVVRECEIAHVGGYGLWLKRGCKECRVEQNHLHDLGAGGARIGEAKMPESDRVESSQNVLRNNYLHDGGHVYAAGVGLWLAQSSHNVISHNEIHSFDYSGMSVGWNWNDAPTRTLHNRIEKNHVHHVVRGVLSDAGGIYTLGTQTGTVVRNNVFHDVWPYMGRPAMAWGIYFDAGSNGLTVENNLVYHTLTGGIMNTGTHGNVVRNNVFALSAADAAWRYTWQKEPSTIVERNILYLTQGELFHADGGRTDFQSKWDKNLYWRTDDRELEFYGQTFADWQAKGVDVNSRVADPKFVDPAHFDFRLQPDSPALDLGFEPIDPSDCGLVGPAEWVALPKQVQFPPTVLPPAPEPPKPVPVDDGFEQTEPGQPPALATVHVEDRPDLLAVTDEAAAEGKRSLRFTDAPGLQHAFNPHMYYQPHFRRGRASLGFDLRVDEGAIVAHQWRDAASPFRVGPSFRIDAGGKLQAGGKPLADVPTGQWIHVEIVCQLGREATGTYDLTLTLPGDPPQAFKQLPCGSDQFKRLDWLGFVSLAQDKAVFYLDNVKLDLAPAG